MTTEALVPAGGEPAVARGGGEEIVLPQVIVDAGPSAVARFLEFFAGRIANARTRAAYGPGGGANSSGGARREDSGCALSRRSTWPPTSGRTLGRFPR